ncbi:MAG: Crp/Fnr family transcriptional regulator [Caulobacterales bacterium]
MPAAASGPDLSGVEAALARSNLFRGLSPDGRTRLAAAGLVVSLESGRQLFAKGEPGDALFVVLEGEVEVRATSEGGRDVRIAALGAGGVIGEMAVLDGEPRSADVGALRRSRLLKIGREAVLSALMAEPRVLIDLVVEMSRRLRVTDAKLEDEALLDLGGKLARLLLQEAAGDRVTLTQTEMARRIGASREKVNRKLHEWGDDGWVQIDRSGVKLIKRGELQALIDALLAR